MTRLAVHLSIASAIEGRNRLRCPSSAEGKLVAASRAPTRAPRRWSGAPQNAPIRRCRDVVPSLHPSKLRANSGALPVPTGGPSGRERCRSASAIGLQTDIDYTAKRRRVGVTPLRNRARFGTIRPSGRVSFGSCHLLQPLRPTTNDLGQVVCLAARWLRGAALAHLFSRA